MKPAMSALSGCRTLIFPQLIIAESVAYVRPPGGGHFAQRGEIPYNTQS